MQIGGELVTRRRSPWRLFPALSRQTSEVADQSRAYTFRTLRYPVAAVGNSAVKLVKHTPLEYGTNTFTFIESSVFERLLPVYLDDDEYAELQLYLVAHPEAGQIIPRSGGVRKLRWARAGAGKRGGLRVIYFVRYRPNQFWMLSIYSKAKHDNIPAHAVRQLLKAFSDE